MKTNSRMISRARPVARGSKKPSESLFWQLHVLAYTPVREHRFDETRRWRFDLAWPNLKFAVEVDGGGFVNGRHSRGTGIEKDCEKYAAALIQGWTVLRVTPRQVTNGLALAWIETIWNTRHLGT